MQDLMRVVVKPLAVVSCAALLVLAWPSRAGADEFDKATYFTFNGPVALPGVTLPAGTYLFRLADPDGSSSVIDVYDETGRTCYGVFLTIPEQESHASDQPSIQFAERPGRAPEAIAAWFYPDDQTGWKFLYANHRANG